jgi:DNA-binding transcriptional MerR regulator
MIESWTGDGHMKMKINEVAKLTGISVRTLHYYDEIGLLHPSEITEAGYRLYDGQALERLQQILFFRELSFPLKEIKSILNNPAFDKHRALENHKKLLLLRRSRLNDLIALVDNTLKGDYDMSFQEFDQSEIENAQKKYAQEAKERYGGTDAYAESEHKTKGYGKEDWSRINTEAEEIYRDFAASMDKEPFAPEVQKLVADWQAHITKNYYNCTKEILAGLGEMYVADARFTESIDKHGKGLAAFMSRSIAYYCK